ncbi:hypothetical protein MNB_SUP05-SYMBIONT-7-620 [hydrothermal vent metagenome]|uniref:Uncharacterized protein n=1 Tax=hydrothermal vent metagenome TaxID=652676 RepID=A0A1W1E4Y1_9ZZZZ
MHSLQKKFESKYQHTLENFKQLSLDTDNNESLCSDTCHKYCNFDTITKQRCQEQNIDKKTSVDTIIFKGNRVYCVEFKNKTRPIKSRDFKQKMIDSKQTLLVILEELKEKYIKYEFIFCAVHKGHNDTSQTILEREQSEYHYHFQSTNRLQRELEGLNQKEGIFFKVLADDVDFFRKQFIQKINKNLPC